MPTLRALECLVAVADSGSISGAAQLLHLSQPAVSHQLATLEREAKSVLLRREARGVRLTAAGRSALPDARRAVEAAAASMHAAIASGVDGAGMVRVASAQSLTVPILAPVIRHWRQRRPDVTVVLREPSGGQQMLDLLDSDEVDVALRPGPVADRYGTVLVAEEDVVVTLPLDHPLTGQPSVTLQDLDGLPMVHFSIGHGLGEWLDRHFAAAGVRPRPVVRTEVTVAAPQLAAAGLGVAVTPVSAVSGGLPAQVRPFSPRWTRSLVAVTAAAPKPLVQRFITDLGHRGLRLPRDVRAQLTGSEDVRHR